MIVHGVRRARRNEMHVNNRARSPSIALVDDMAVRIDLQRAIKMRARLDGTFPVVFDFATPKNGLAFFVGGLEFEPHVKGINGAARKEMANAAGSNDHIDAQIIATPDCSIGAINRGSYG